MATVPISDGNPRNTYTASGGQTIFPYTFWIREEDHIAVYVNDVLKTLTTDYTVSAVKQPTGANVVFNSGLTADDEVVLVYDPEYERTSEFTGTIRLDSLNEELTYNLTLIKNNKRLSDLAVKLSDFETTNFSTNLPNLTGNGGKFLGLKSDLSGFEYLSISNDSNVVSNYESQTFDGDNSTTVFNLSFTPSNQAGMFVFVDDAIQVPVTEYSVSGTTLTFVTAPPTGTGNVVVRNTTATATVNTPSDNSVTTAKMVDLNVTTAKIANDAVTVDKISDTLINAYTSATPAAGDEILFGDISDSNNMRKGTVQGILNLVTSDMFSKSTVTPVLADSLPLFDDSDSNSGKKATIESVISLAVTTAYAETTTADSHSVDIPQDSTIPQNTEGSEILTLAYTPKSATSKLRIEWQCPCSASALNIQMVCALFVDTDADALAIGTSEVAAGGTDGVTVNGYYEVTSGSTTARTYKLRYGGVGAATYYANQLADGSTYGGLLKTFIKITEIAGT